jgi:rod shape-determining protein MreC
MKKRKKYNKIYKLLFIFSIIFIVIIIYFYNDNILELKELSTSIFNLKEDKYKSKENNEINELKKEIKELKEINNINKSNIEYNYVDASIIKRNNSYWNEYITINVGKKQGIKKGYAVTKDNTLIGIISNVYNNTSLVKLITSNSDNYISAKFTLDNKEYFGIIKKYNVIKNELYLENVIGDFNLSNEDVITSGLEGIIPSGIYIGKIFSIEKDKYNLSSTITIKPSINYNNIKYVKVITK